jgi:hypothetical protein
LLVFIWERDGVKVIVPVFVDNITLASKSKEKIAKVKGLLAQRFKLHNLPTSFLLGVQIDCKQLARTLHLSQHQNTLDLRIALALQTAAPPPRRSTLAHALTCPSARRRLRTPSSCATSRT